MNSEIHLLAFQASCIKIGPVVAGSAGPVPLPLYNMHGYIH